MPDRRDGGVVCGFSHSNEHPKLFIQSPCISMPCSHQHLEIQRVLENTTHSVSAFDGREAERQQEKHFLKTPAVMLDHYNHSLVSKSQWLRWDTIRIHGYQQSHPSWFRRRDTDCCSSNSTMQFSSLHENDDDHHQRRKKSSTSESQDETLLQKKGSSSTIEVSPSFCYHSPILPSTSCDQRIGPPQSVPSSSVANASDSDSSYDRFESGSRSESMPVDESVPLDVSLAGKTVLKHFSLSPTHSCAPQVHLTSSTLDDAYRVDDESLGFVHLCETPLWSAGLSSPHWKWCKSRNLFRKRLKVTLTAAEDPEQSQGSSCSTLSTTATELRCARPGACRRSDDHYPEHWSSSPHPSNLPMRQLEQNFDVGNKNPSRSLASLLVSPHPYSSYLSLNAHHCIHGASDVESDDSDSGFVSSSSSLSFSCSSLSSDGLDFSMDDGTKSGHHQQRPSEDRVPILPYLTLQSGMKQFESRGITNHSIRAAGVRSDTHIDMEDDDDDDSMAWGTIRQFRRSKRFYVSDSSFRANYWSSIPNSCGSPKDSRSSLSVPSPGRFSHRRQLRQQWSCSQSCSSYIPFVKNSCQSTLWPSDCRPSYGSGLGFSKLGSSGLGSSKFESPGLEYSRLGFSELGSSGLGSSEVDSYGLEFAQLGFSELRSSGLGSLSYPPSRTTAASFSGVLSGTVSSGLELSDSFHWSMEKPLSSEGDISCHPNSTRGDVDVRHRSLLWSSHSPSSCDTIKEIETNHSREEEREEKSIREKKEQEERSEREEQKGSFPQSTKCPSPRISQASVGSFPSSCSFSPLRIPRVQGICESGILSNRSSVSLEVQAFSPFGVSQQHQETVCQEHQETVVQEHQQPVCREHQQAVSQEHQQAVSQEHQQAVFQERQQAVSQKHQQAVSEEHQQKVSSEHRHHSRNRHSMNLSRSRRRQQRISDMDVHGWNDTIDQKEQRSSSLSSSASSSSLLAVSSSSAGEGVGKGRSLTTGSSRGSHRHHSDNGIRQQDVEEDVASPVKVKRVMVLTKRNGFGRARSFSDNHLNRYNSPIRHHHTQGHPISGTPCIHHPMLVYQRSRSHSCTDSLDGSVEQHGDDRRTPQTQLLLPDTRASDALVKGIRDHWSTLLLERWNPEFHLETMKLLQNPIRRRHSLRLQAGGSMKPSFCKRNTSGEDALFVSINNTDPSNQAVGVADGVSEWTSYGIDGAKFPRELMRYCQLLSEETCSLSRVLGVRNRAHALLTAAMDRTKAIGGSTACVGCLNSPQTGLEYANLGDSGVAVFNRDATTGLLRLYFKSEQQQHCSNMPYQLTNLPKLDELYQFDQLGLHALTDVTRRYYLNGRIPSIDSALYDASTGSIPLLEGSLILMATDGFWDNLHLYEIEELISISIAPCEAKATIQGGRPSLCSMGTTNSPTHSLHSECKDSSLASTCPTFLAQVLVDAAYERSKSPPTLSCPLHDLHRESSRGGKPDDIALVACWVI